MTENKIYCLIEIYQRHKMSLYNKIEYCAIFEKIPELQDTSYSIESVYEIIKNKLKLHFDAIIQNGDIYDYCKNKEIIIYQNSPESIYVSLPTSSQSFFIYYEHTF